ncbi:MAG TPA: TauD/TfdA family dioxygenase [Stellaceae bacterium]|nr:TauD/TfdA family dioxygenase [Stellaceae bacterium]
MTIEIRRLADALGGEVLGVDLSRPLTPEVVADLKRAWIEYQVLVFRGQSLTMEDQRRFVEGMGELQPTRSRPGQRANPDVMYIGNITVDGDRGELPEGEMQFHTDQCYYECPAKGAVLYALEIPSRGGNTMFASTYRAYETLPPALKARVAALDVLFVYDYLKNANKKAPTDWSEVPHYVHPAVIVHPESGRPALLVNRLMADSFVGLARGESDALLERLCSHMEQRDMIYEHVWRKGDVLIWDNLSTAHARTDFDPSERRSLRRMALKGTKPAALRNQRTVAAAH